MFDRKKHGEQKCIPLLRSILLCIFIKREKVRADYIFYGVVDFKDKSYHLEILEISDVLVARKPPRLSHYYSQ